LIGLGFGTFERVYATGAVSGSSLVGGLVGNLTASGVLTDSIWDTDTTGIPNPFAVGVGSVGSPGGDVFGLTTTDALVTGNYPGVFNFGFSSFNSIWFQLNGETRPFLHMERSTTLHNSHELQLLELPVDYTANIHNDINLSLITDPAQHWGTSSPSSGKGFFPLSQSIGHQGMLLGNGHTISNLFVNRPSAQNVGLYGITRLMLITDLAVTDVDLTGASRVGALIGKDAEFGIPSIVRDVSSSGTVTATSISNAGSVGGLIGLAPGTLILGSSSSVDIFAPTIFAPLFTPKIGGLVGDYQGRGALLTGLSATGNIVDGGDQVGGLIGRFRDADY